MDITKLDCFAELRGRKQSLAGQQKKIQADMDALEEEIVEEMVEEGTDSLKRNGFTFFLSSKMQTKILIGTDEAARKFIEDHGETLGFLATVNHAKLKSYIGEAQEDGAIELTIPDDLKGVVDATRIPSLGCRKAS